MKSKGILALTLSVLLLYMPVSSVAASSAAAKMITTGTAEINGVVAPAVTSAFAGDRISTEKEATTSLSFPGGDAVVIPELTRAALDEQDGHVIVSLEDGTVSVLNKSKTPIVIEAHGARIEAAANQPALYDVTLHGNALRVVARGGAAVVETANHTAEVQPGNALSATLAPNPPAAPQAALTSSSTWTWVGVGAGVGGLTLGAVSLAKVDNCHLSASSNQVSC
jgi:hypothetical protein